MVVMGKSRKDLSPEEINKKRQADLRRYHARRAAMTPEQLEAARERRRAYESKHRAENREKFRQKSSAYRNKNREKLRELHRSYSRSYRERNPEASRKAKERYNNTEKGALSKRRYLLRKCYGLTLEEYNTLWKQQGSCCAACKSSEFSSGVNWHVDHCHTSGAVRGILCPSCNIALGQVGDSIEKLYGLISYLEAYNAED